MATFLTKDQIESELGDLAVIDEGRAGPDRANYNALTDRDFELLLYSIYKHRMQSDGWYDSVRLMTYGADQGRDVWLTLREVPVGLVQCKRVKQGYSAPEALREAIKFLLFADLDASLLPNPHSFCFCLATSSEPAGTTAEFFQTPEVWLKKRETRLQADIEKVKSQYASFEQLSIDEIFGRIKARLFALRFQLLQPVDLDEWLEAAASVRARFFKTQLVIDLDSASRLFSEKLEVLGLTPTASGISPILARLEELSGRLPVTTTSPLSQKLIDQEVRREIEIVRQCRFFHGAESFDRAKALATRLVSGDLASASGAIRASAIAWCARWISTKAEPEEVQDLLTVADAIAPSEESTIAAAFVAGQSSWKSGLTVLSPLNTPARMTAALQIVLRNENAEGALRWARDAGLNFSDFEPDGRLVFMSCHTELQNWNTAYELAVDLTEVDFLTTPALQQFAAMARISRSVPTDLMYIVANGVPLDASGFPLADDPPSLTERQIAAGLMRAASNSASSLGAVSSARLFASMALWLELRDPNLRHSAIEQLDQLLGDREEAVTYVPLALSFGLNLDLAALEQALDRESALNPWGSVELALARIALVQKQPTAPQAWNYFDRHRDLLEQQISAVGFVDLEVQLLSEIGRFEQAKSLLKQNRVSLSPDHHIQLQSLVNRAESGDPTIDFETIYMSNPSTANLAQLVGHLGRQGYSDRFLELAKQLIVSTRAQPDLESAVNLLLREGRFNELAELLDEFEEITATSPDLRSALAWSFFRQGKFNKALEILAALRIERDEINDRILTVNLLICSGRWPELSSFVESGWNKREDEDAAELLRLAQLANQVGSERVPELLKLAAYRAPDDPDILLGCYTTAVDFGCEDKIEAYDWFDRAARLSGEKGPIKSVSLKDMVGQAPDWQRRVEEAWDKVRLCQLPLFAAGTIMRRPALELQLAAMIRSQHEPDPRRRDVVPCYAGTRRQTELKADSIALDLSSLITLASVDVLECVFDRFDKIWIPHSTLSCLFEERQGLSFHQPSRVRDAHDLAQSVATGRLHRFLPTSTPTPELCDQVGQPLAGMLLTASGENEGEIQKIVVRSAPVHRIGSFRDEVVDLGSFENALCSCLAIIDKLAERGQLTIEEEARARKYLERQEHRWPNEPIISDGAHLYLDDLSVSYLRTAGVLQKLTPAGLRPYISEGEIDEAAALIEFKNRADSTFEVIERLRNSLAKRIMAGNISVAKALPDDELQNHPNIAVAQLAGVVDAIVSDDRYMNRHQTMDSETGRSAIWTSHDVLSVLRSVGDLTDHMLWQHHTMLRRSGYVHLPTSADELSQFVERSRTQGGQLVETGELKAFRESLLLAQMRGWLNLPAEAHWLSNLASDIAHVIVEQWTEEISDEDARSKSHWLISLLDLRNWSVQPDQGSNIGQAARFGHAVPLINLMLRGSALLSDECLNRFWSWLEEDAVDQLKLDDPQAYEWFISNLRSLIAQQTGQTGSGHE